MTTLRYKIFEFILKRSGAGETMTKALTRGHIRSQPVPKKVAGRWEKSNFQDRNIWTCRPAGKQSNRVYVHQHGGGYVVGLLPLQFETMTKLADMAGVTIIMPDYPLPPDNTAAEIIDWAAAHYASVVAEHGAENVRLGGDSAGGNLALAIGQQMAVEKPLLLLSPWVDLVPSDTDMPDDMANNEILLAPATVKAAGRQFAGELPVDTPLISPIYADPKDLPEVMIFTGEKDLLHPQIMKFADAMKPAGKLRKLATYGEFGHYWMFYPTPDRGSTLAELAAILSA